MTEDSRGSVDNPPRGDDQVPGFAAEQQSDGPASPPDTADDIEQVADEQTAEPAAEPVDTPADTPDETPTDRPADTPFDTPFDTPVDEQADAPVDEQAADPGFMPPDGPADKLLVSAPPPAPMERPAPYEPYGQPPPYQEPSQYGQEPAPPIYGPDNRPRPGFVPHDGHEPSPYGWPRAAQHQGPPPPAGPPLSTAPPPPGGAPPLGQPRPPGQPGAGMGFGGPGGGGPNWAPVPAPPSPSRGGPALGALAVVALVVALVAGAVGAGIGVMAADDDSPSNGSGYSLGNGSEPGGSDAKNRPPDSVAGVAARVLPGVVMIRVRSGNEGGAGTGFIVKGGYIITNNHVVAPAANGGEIEVVFHDKKVSPATVKGRDPSSDIAVLQPQTTHNLPALQVGNSDSLAVGDPVIAVGSPLGFAGSVTTGIVSSLNRAVPTKGEGADSGVIPAIQTDAAINPGNSGGPLVDGKGQVVGINTAIATLGGSLGGEQGGNIGLGFAIPINHGKRVAEEIINTGGAKRALIGIGMDQQFQGPGARIADKPQGSVAPIVKGGPADKAGLKPGDIITAIDGKPVENRIELVAFIRSKAPGDRIKVTYTRGGKETTVDVVLGEAN